MNFDKKENGEFDLHKEGGHSEFRILHHKDNTGAEIQTSLIEAVKRHPNITVFENFYAVEIITQHHQGIIVTRYTPGIKCYGAYVLNEQTGEVDTFLSKLTVMATGGCEAVYRNTTNPLVATGDGIAMVYRAKGMVKDMEFIQFHPTALFNPGDRPSFLITEAMRGYGAVLRTQDGNEFMQKYDARLSLAPRDIVARAIDNEMKQRGEDHVYLDVTHKDRRRPNATSRTSTRNASASASTSPKTTSPWRRQPITCAEASRSTSTDSRASAACMPWANVRAPDCMEATAWLPTRSSKR